MYFILSFSLLYPMRPQSSNLIDFNFQSFKLCFTIPIPNFRSNNSSDLWSLTLSSLNLPLSSSSSTSRELLSQFSTWSGWRWFDVGDKLKKIIMYTKNNFIEICLLKTLAVKKIKYVFNGVKWCFNASCGLKSENCETNVTLTQVLIKVQKDPEKDQDIATQNQKYLFILQDTVYKSCRAGALG